MKKIFYNKLIRDKIPAKMDRIGAAYEIRAMKRKEFELELVKKAGEETSGLLSARGRGELIEELADVLDVISEIKRIRRIKNSELEKARRKNAETKGGFEKKIFLVWSEDTGYRTNERTS